MRQTDFGRTRKVVELAKTDVNSLVYAVYLWMSVGLCITGGIAWYAGTSNLVNEIILNMPLFIGLMVGELALVMILATCVTRLSSFACTAIFLLYSALNGITLSVIFLTYTKTSIVSTFFICASTFAVCSIYGWFTKKDLTSMGSFMFMGLIGLIIAMFVNMFLRSPAMQYLISAVGIIVFVGLTAFDTQKIKEMAMTMPNDIGGGAIRKGAIMGALTLYLDFINLFLFFLRFFGISKD